MDCFEFSHGEYKLKRSLTAEETKGWSEFLGECQGANNILYQKLEDKSIDQQDWEMLSRITKAEWDNALENAKLDNQSDGSWLPALDEIWEGWVVIAIGFCMGVLILLGVMCCKNNTNGAIGGPQGHHERAPLIGNADAIRANALHDAYELAALELNSSGSSEDFGTHSRDFRRLLRGTHAPFADLA